LTDQLDVPAGAADSSAAPAAAPTRKSRPRRRRTETGYASALSALPWLIVPLILIVGVVVYPAIALVKASLSEYSFTGLRKGSAGFGNYSKVFHDDDLWTVLANTGIWVAVTVALTILIGLGLAQFMAKEFYGRRVMRWAIIIPWAASLVITARLFTLILDYSHGILNQLLTTLHIIGKPVDFLGDDRFVMPSMIGVGVFVSLPFTGYVLLAGLNAIPDDIVEAARMDGASPGKIYRYITLPLLRPALLVASVLNLIYVFNSFPVIYTLNDRNPGFSHDTSITYSYKLAFKAAERSVGMSAAMGVINVLLILVVVLIYLRIIRWREVTQA